MLMSAGLATRLTPFSKVIPKPLVPLMGVPMIDYHFELLKDQGYREVVINLHHKASLIEDHVQKFQSDFNILFSDEKKEVLGSAGGLAHAKENLSDSFIYLNCGDLRSIDLNELERKHLELKQKKDVHLTMALFPSKNPAEKYTEIKVKGDSIVDLIKDQFNVPFFVGAAVIEKKCIDHLDSNSNADFVSEILKPAIVQKKAGVFMSDGVWADAGSPQTWWKAHFDLMQQIDSKDFPSSWRQLILNHTKKINDRIWTINPNLNEDDFSHVENVFWGSSLDPSYAKSDLVYYSDQPQDGLSLKKGIGYNDLFVRID